MRHSYAAYGLAIQSVLPLPELPEAVSPPDVTIRYGPCGDWGAECAAVDYAQAVHEDGARLFWKGTGAFLVRQGREVVVDPAPGADLSLVRAALLGPVLAALLHQRRFLVLHASGVALPGGAAAFLADAGEGKSTTAAAFYREGYPVVADDLMAVRGTSGATVEIGYPQLRLCADVLEALGVDPASLSRASGADGKRCQPVASPAQAEPLPLLAVYVLQTADAIKVERLSQSEAMRALTRFTFASSLLGPAGLRDHFAQCADLARRGLVRRLSRPRDLAYLPAVIEAVRTDAGA